ncbi:MAG: DUF6226 family protein [Actinomycetota bacterium]
MVSIAELERAVDDAFAVVGRPFAPWPDPNPDRDPDEDAYSRLTNPAKYLIIGARVDAWIEALSQFGLAEPVPDEGPVWVEEEPRVTMSRSDRLVPRNAGALSLLVCRTDLGDIAGAGIVLGVGDPVEPLGWFPDCGCDACDSGSDADLEHLDAYIRGVVTGEFRRLRRGRQSITVIDPPGWMARGLRRVERVGAILANPDRWSETTGASWL